MGCIEQQPINQEVSSILKIDIEEIDVLENTEYIKQYRLKVTPTIVILQDGEEKKRFEGLVHREELEGEIRKYL
jgi:thioredoxin 1